MRKTWLLLAALLFSAAPFRAQDANVPAAQGAPAAGQRGVLWAAWIDQHGADLWADEAPPVTKQAVADYLARKALPSGKIYGDSIRGLRLGGKTPEEINTLLRDRGFSRHDSVIHDSKTHAPVLDLNQQPVPMTIYTNDDGGVVRVKPVGDPTDRFRKQPDAVKAVDNPPDADYTNFDNEAFKVEAAGDRPIPKWPREMKNPYKDTPLSNSFLDGWGDSAHADVKAAAASRH